LVPAERIENRILLIRGQKVMIDRDLAELYGVETKYLNRQVKRNMERFPKEFMFQLNNKEKKELVTNCHRLITIKHSSTHPYVFTEHGVAMLASVLNSKRAIKISINIIKIFIRLRKYLVAHKKITQKLIQLEQKIKTHDTKIKDIFKAIHCLMAPSAKTIRQIGFRVG
jgi:phage regulator Rha-like protein